MITTIDLTTQAIAPNQVSKTQSGSTSLDPAVAGVVLYHINSKMAVKGVFIYKIAAAIGPWLRRHFSTEQ